MAVSLQTRDIRVDERGFAVQVLCFSNGCFATVAEGTAPRLGAVVVALHTEGRANVSTVVPSRHAPVFPGMLAEALARQVHGIAIVSFFARDDVSPTGLKTLMITALELAQTTRPTPHGDLSKP